MIEVRWEKSALDRHEEWALGIAVEFTLTHAKTYLAEIQSAEVKISSHPHIGTDYESPRKNLKRFVTHSGYSVYYQLDDLTVPKVAVIVAIIRGQREL